MKILITGSDGYLGVPVMSHLNKKHEVIGIDNFNKKIWMNQVGVIPINNPPSSSIAMDVRSETFAGFIKKFLPDVVIHFGEQCSAPYSMISRQHAWETMENNLNGTLNLVFAIKEYCPDCHIVKIGTMGEYGTPNIDIEEGWLDIHHNGRSDRLLYPKTPHSLYHLSKVSDSDLLAFASRVWGLKITDLNQGFVYGIHETESRFCYDAIFGTVLNRFVVQAVAGHPLTVYGKGGQTRGCLDIRDTIQCIELAIENPPENGEFRVFNQFTEQWSVNDLAEKVSRITGSRIEHIKNPRKEKESHYYNAVNTNLHNLGLSPHLLSDETIENMLLFVEKHKEYIRVDQIMPGVKW